MFINSEQLKERIQIISDEITLKSGGRITFSEYISLPYYGYIILRFHLNENPYTIADIDHFEALMYNCVGDEFLIDFTGEVYRNIGINYRNMEKLFSNCLHLYRNERLYKSAYAEMIENDAKQLLALCNLPLNLPVWEIQLEEEIHLILLGNSNKPLGRYSKDDRIVHVYQVASAPCEGLVTAVFYAKRNNVSLATALMTAQDLEQSFT